MKKYIIILTVTILCLTTSAYSQCEYLEKALNYMNEGNYVEALNYFNSTKDFCPDKVDEVDRLIISLVQKIEQEKNDLTDAKMIAEEKTKEARIAQGDAENQKRIAERERSLAIEAKKTAEEKTREAREAQAEAENQKRIARNAQVKAEEERNVANRAKLKEENQKRIARNAQVKAEEERKKSKKLSNHFDFYLGKYAAVTRQPPRPGSNQNVCYFIDSNGNKVTKLGVWAKVGAFNFRGLASVKKEVNGKLISYLLDSYGKFYRVRYKMPGKKMIGSKLPSYITALDLSGQNLSSIPPMLFTNTQLQILILDNNQITYLPAQIGNLRNLRHLHIRNNNLSNLPIQVGNLRNLIHLDLRSNRIKVLPVQIGSWVNLKYLALGTNKLVHLPAHIGNLKKLTHLYLGGNSLVDLPGQFGNLSNLSVLGLAGNRISNIDILRYLSKLKKLYLNRNPISPVGVQTLKRSLPKCFISF